jgi:hypothetical protein
VIGISAVVTGLFTKVVEAGGTIFYDVIPFEMLRTYETMP